MSAVTTPHPPHTPWRRLGFVGVGLAAVVGIVVVAFLWPTVTSSVKSVPVGIVGPSAITSTLETALNTKAPGVFRYVEYGTKTDAVDAIKSRAVYGAIVFDTTPEILTASAASPVVAQLLGALAPALQSQANAAAQAQTAQAQVAMEHGAKTAAPIVVTPQDIVPLASTDSRGAGLAASSFPLVLSGMLGGILISLLIVGVWRRVTVVLIYVVCAGLGLTAILQGWFGTVQGNYLANAAAIALTLLAISGVIVGFVSLLGRPGILVGPVVYLLIANPISAAAQPLEFLAAPWGALGQWFPPGAAATLIRDLSYFPAADVSFPWLILAGWAEVGLMVALAGHLRDTGAATRAAVKAGLEGIELSRAGRHVQH